MISRTAWLAGLLLLLDINTQAAAQGFTYLKGPEAELASYCVGLGLRVPKDATPVELLDIAFGAAQGRVLPWQRAYYAGDGFGNWSREDFLLPRPAVRSLFLNQGTADVLLVLDGFKASLHFFAGFRPQDLSLTGIDSLVARGSESQRFSDIQNKATGTTFMSSCCGSGPQTVREHEFRQLGPYLLGVSRREDESYAKIETYVFLYKRLDN